MKLNNAEMLKRLEKVLNIMGNLYTVEDIRYYLRVGHMTAFVNEEPSGCIITDVSDYPQKRVLNVVAGFGTIEGIVALIPQLYAHAEENRCDTFYMRGRPGWARVLPKHGYGNTKLVSELKFDFLRTE